MGYCTDPTRTLSVPPLAWECDTHIVPAGQRLILMKEKVLYGELTVSDWRRCPQRAQPLTQYPGPALRTPSRLWAPAVTQSDVLNPQRSPTVLQVSLPILWQKNVLFLAIWMQTPTAITSTGTFAIHYLGLDHCTSAHGFPS